MTFIQIISTLIQDMKKNSHKYFCNRECEYYPCHDLDNINCIFCFCPLYSYNDCEGRYTIVNGKKDCSKCILPHTDYDHIINILKNKLEGARQ